MGLDANEWKVRLEAIDNFYDLIRTNPEGVSRNVSKVCDFQLYLHVLAVRTFISNIDITFTLTFS